MRKVLTFSILTLAALSLMAATAFACGEKGIKTQKASSVNVSASCDGADGPVKKAAAVDGEWVVRTISVKGMTCTGCEESIKAELVKVPGVVEVVKVCHKSAEAVVKVDPSKAQDVQLAKAITDKGYEAEVIPAVAKTEVSSSKGPVCPFSGGPGCDAVKKAGADCQKSESTKASTEKTDKKSDDKKSDDMH